ncbi:arabinose efflux permease family protein [Deinococcus peraridilitoris DSM 19664]|uniref:Arabinose efflux permease family protein n=2 Tax=Deinococcus TaxID=1298 RepID=L0A4E3_DEIPD|nr:arabinose efflux permease family protein [Deinococcus peraridilitoris DSM 19664]
MRIVTSFLSRMVGGAVFPFLAIYFTTQLGAALAGLLLALLVGVQFLAGLYGGALADAWGRRRTLLAGEALKVAAFTGMLLANLDGPHPWWTFAAVCLVNVASGLINPAAEAMLMDVSTPESRTFMYAVNYWAVNASLLIGTLLGGWLYGDHFTLLLALLVGMSLVTFALVWKGMSETRAGKSSKAVRQELGWRPLARSYARVFRDRAFALFTLAGIAVLSIEFGRSNFVAVHLAQDFPAQLLAGVSLDGVRVLSLLTGLNTLMIVLLTAPVTAWVDRWNKRPYSTHRLMFLGFALFATGFALLAAGNSLSVLLIGTLVLSLGELLYVPTRQALLADLIPENQRGAYLAVNGQIFTLAKWVAALGVPLGALIGGVGMAALTVLLGLLGIWLSRLALSTGRPSGVPQVGTV